MAQLITAGQSANGTYKTPAQIAQENYLAAINANKASLVQNNGTSLTKNALANTTSNALADTRANYGVTTPTVTPTTAPTTQTVTTTPTVTPQQVQQVSTPQFDSTAYINQLAQAQKAQKLADLQKAYGSNLSTLNSQQAALAPQYYNLRNNASTASQLQAKNFAEYLANRGQTNAGVAGQSELNRGMQLQSNIGNLNTQEQAANNDINTKKTDLANALQNDIVSANAGIDADTMKTLIDQYNTDRNYGLSKASTDASVANTNAGTVYQNLINVGYPAEQAAKMAQASATLESTNLSNDAQAIQNKYADAIAQGQINSQTLQNAYQSYVNQGYSAKQASDLAYQKAQTQAVLLNNEAQKISNKYAAEIAQGTIDQTKLENTYKTLVNKGVEATTAADIAYKYAQINNQNASATKKATTTTTTKSTTSTKYNYKNDANFKSDYASVIANPEKSLSAIKANAQQFINAYGVDGYKALLNAAQSAYNNQ